MYIKNVLPLWVKTNKRKLKEYKKEAKEKYKDFREEIKEQLCKKQLSQFRKFQREENRKYMKTRAGKTHGAGFL